MTSSSSPEEKPSIIVDEDWKTKVQREKEGNAGEQAAPAASSSQKDIPEKAGAASQSGQNIPAPDFMTLIGMFSTQAMVSLGMIPNPGSQEVEVNLPLARHFIDLLGVLEAKTTGNRTNEESQAMESNLHYLRMAFLEISSKPKN